MKLTLHVWRQKDRSAEGAFVTYEAPDVSPDMSFLEMLDGVNERLIARGEDPIAFDHDCRFSLCLGTRPRDFYNGVVPGRPPWLDRTRDLVHVREGQAHARADLLDTNRSTSLPFD